MVGHEEIVSRAVGVMQEMAAPQDDGLSLVLDDRLRLEDYVSASVGPAVLSVMKFASGVNVLSLKGEEGVSYSSGKVTLSGGLRGRYVKLYRLQLSGWERPVGMGVSEDSEEAKKQYNPFTRSACDKPVVVEHKHAGEVVLSCYPGGDRVLEDFLAEVSYDATEGLHAMDTRFSEAVVYATAGIVYNEMRMADAGARMTELMLSVLGLTVGQG